MRALVSGAATTIVLASGLFLLVWVQHAQAYELLLAQTDAALCHVAMSTASSVDGAAMARLVRREQEDSPAWDSLAAPLRTLLRADLGLRYAYLMRRDGDSVRFVVDASPPGDRDGDGRDDHAYLGEAYTALSPELLKALDQGHPITDRHMIPDPWGVFVSGYAPVYDDAGHQVGILGVDMPAAGYLDQLASLHRVRNAALLASLLAALAAGAGVAGAVTRRETRRERLEDLWRRRTRRREALNRRLEAGILERTQALKESNAALERALQARIAFLTQAGHELRTPLQHLLSAFELLQEDIPSPLPRQRQRLEALDRSIQELRRLVEEILEYALARSDHLPLHAVPVDLARLLQEAVPHVPRAVLTTASPRGAVVSGDETRLRQLVARLLEEASTHARGASIAVELETERIPGRVILGLVVPRPVPSEPERLFTPFAPLRDDTGTGLSLPLVRTLARLHGGEATLSGTTERTRYEVVLPRAVHPAPLPATDPSPDQGPARILLAEDNPDIRETLGEFLESRGYRVTLADNGRSALELARRTPPDLVVMDLQMPEMDGLEATRLLRTPPFPPDLPIVVMTAFSGDEERNRCHEAGASTCLCKPVELRKLDELLRRLLAQAPHA